MGEHILEIVVMLLGAAILGFFIGWFLQKNKISDLEEYITTLEEKNNRLQGEYNENERALINCQTEKKKTEADKGRIETLLVECQGKLTVSDVELAKKEIDAKTEKTIKVNKKTDSKQESKKKITKKSPTLKPDNLTKIEGIGPKLSGILQKAGIETFKKLSEVKPEKISEILVKAGGNKYKRFDPETWPNQAKLATEGKWDELKKWQDEMKGGRE
ncbi:MAG: hypothetical protein L3J35_04800 [Bacteroidales bacterium]|nr:hypothetical protein [Bacteroidales bacterium]